MCAVHVGPAARRWTFATAARELQAAVNYVESTSGSEGKFISKDATKTIDPCMVGDQGHPEL